MKKQMTVRELIAQLEPFAEYSVCAYLNREGPAQLYQIEVAKEFSNGMILGRESNSIRLQKNEQIGAHVVLLQLNELNDL